MSMAEDTRKRPDFSDPSNPAPASDPLAELARLIGQSDPFTDLSKRAGRKPLDSVQNDDRPAPEWLARPAAPSEPEYDEPHVPQQAYRAEHHDEPAQHPDYRPHVAPGGFADAPHYAHDERAQGRDAARREAM